MRPHFATDIEGGDSSGSGDARESKPKHFTSTVMGRGLIPQGAARPTQAATVLEGDDSSGSGATVKANRMGPAPITATSRQHFYGTSKQSGIHKAALMVLFRTAAPLEEATESPNSHHRKEPPQ